LLTSGSRREQPQADLRQTCPTARRSDRVLYENTVRLNLYYPPSPTTNHRFVGGPVSGSLRTRVIEGTPKPP
jgi:hypothetical protein